MRTPGETGEEAGPVADGDQGVLAGPGPTSDDEAQAQAGDGGAEGRDIPVTRTETNKSIAEALSLPHEILFVSLICSAQLTTQAGLGQTLAILHVIGDSFGITDPGELSWLIAGYSLTVGTFILFSGRLGDVFGYKRMLLIGFAWFSIWSVVAGCAVYSNHALFVFARVLQGVGPAICMPNALAILGATYAPGRRKAMVFALFGAMAPGGAILGAAFASLFALAFWPWAFWSFAIALACLAVAGHFILPDPPHKVAQATPLRTKIRDLDLPGAFTGVVGLVLFNFAWNQAPITGWQSPAPIVTLILGVLFGAAFFVIEIRYSHNPLIPFGALRADVYFVLAAVACGWGCFGIWVYYTWQRNEVVTGASPLLATAYFAPVAVSGAVAAVVTGMVLAYLGPAVVMALALLWFTAGSILSATAPVGQTYWAQMFVTTVVMPWGMDMSFPAATIMLSDAVRKEHQGIAASLVSTIVNYSISIGLGLGGTVEVYTNNGGNTPADILRGYHAAQYFGIGLAGLGILVCGALLFKQFRSKGGKEEEAEEDEKPEA